MSGAEYRNQRNGSKMYSRVRKRPARRPARMPTITDALYATANSLRLTARLRRSSPLCAPRIRLAAIRDGRETKKGLAQPTRTTDSQISRIEAKDKIPKHTGRYLRISNFIFRHSIVFVPMFVLPRWPQIRKRKPERHKKEGNPSGIPSRNA